MSIACQFDEFFRALWPPQEPFPWQRMLAEEVAAGEWPDSIELPTASGKTGCLDVAVFTLAHQAERAPAERTAPRRIWLVVDRRIVVDEAFSRAQKISKALAEAVDGPLAYVAGRLRSLSGPDSSRRPPLAVARLRGGLLRDDRWARVPSQPAIITSTVDQLGSRLLFRSYGWGDLTASIYAGLASNDSLIVLDEAHCAQPFMQTLRAIKRFRGAEWAEQPVASPFAAVIMSATPPPGANKRFPDPGQGDTALDHPKLRLRLTASKPAELRIAAKSAARKKDPATDTFPAEALAVVQRFLDEHRCGRVSVMVNRVRTAQEIAALLRAELGERAGVDLLIGPMRALERDELVKRLTKIFAAVENPVPIGQPRVLITTQCLEVGADFSFDALVTECASLDALRQRFGRLDRLGAFGNSCAAVLIREIDIAPKEPDPIYGEALPETWQWLSRNADQIEGIKSIDFGVAALESKLPADYEERRALLRRLAAPAESAPVLLPAHLDALCQTAPRPEPEPAVSVFLHGPNTALPEVRVVWRADLDEHADDEAWLEALSLCPPGPGERLTTTLPNFKRWICAAAAGNGRDVRVQDDLTDLEGRASLPQEEERAETGHPRRFLIWRGRKESRAGTLADLQPGDVVVVPANYGAPQLLGHVQTIGNEVRDIAEAARLDVPDTPILRLHPRLAAQWGIPDFTPFLHMPGDEEEEGDRDELRAHIASVLGRFAAGEIAGPDWLRKLAARLEPPFSLVPHPTVGWVLIGRRVLDVEEDESADEDDLRSIGEGSVPLEAHTRAVVECIERTAGLACSFEIAKALRDAAILHDLGKADWRFQLLLQNGDELALRHGAELLAKSAHLPTSRQRRAAIYDASGLPRNFRHEMATLELLQNSTTGAVDDLILHLVASHHGYARPFAPVVADPMAPALHVALGENQLTLDATHRRESPPFYRADSGIAERFWRLTRRYGWWGLAYLEAIFRTADWEASAHAVPVSYGDVPRIVLGGDAPPTQTPHELPLAALDGANPLGFFAALGTLKLLSEAGVSTVRVRWQSVNGAWRPVLVTTEPFDENAVIQILAAALRLGAVAPGVHPHLALGKNLSVSQARFREFAQHAQANSSSKARRAADFMTSFGSEAFKHESLDRVYATELHFSFGSGHQHYLETIKKLIESTTAEKLRDALFRRWNYEDERLSMRWDPEDAREHAYQWTAPANEVSLTVWGANLLAAEGSTFFPVMPQDRSARTTGFRDRGARAVFTWPIWLGAITADCSRSLLSLAELTSNQPDLPRLRERGIVAVFRCRKLKIGEGQNFKWAFSPSQML